MAHSFFDGSFSTIQAMAGLIFVASTSSASM
jgi:hypothetical protein